MLKKILLTVLAILVLAVVGVYLYIQSSWDKTYDWPSPALKTTTDSATIARGKYLVNGPAHCISCHVSGFDDLVKGDKGEEVPKQGGVKFNMGPLGSMYTAI